MSTFRPIGEARDAAPPGYTAAFKKAHFNPMLATPSDDAVPLWATLRKGPEVAWEGWISARQGVTPSCSALVAALRADEALVSKPAEAVMKAFNCDRWTAAFVQRAISRRTLQLPAIRAPHPTTDVMALLGV